MNVIIPKERRKTRAETELEAAFARVGAGLPSRGRAAAFQRFASAGLPHRRVEAYHYTDLRSLIATAPEPAARPSLAEATAAVGADVFGAIDAARVVLVDGWFSPKLSDLSGLGEGVTVASIGDTFGAGRSVPGLGKLIVDRPAEADPLVALASAFWTDGVVIRVAPGAAMARPLEIRHLSTGKSVMACVRHLVEVGAGASAEIFETHESPDGVLIHAHGLTELSIGEGARVTLIDRQREGDEAVRLATLVVSLGDDAHLDHTLVTLGAKLARTQIFARLGARVDLQTRGATLARGRTHADATLVVEHAGANSVSRELYKSAVDGEASSVFQGKITVEPTAQKTDGRMGAHAVLLSDRAEATAKPELEIFADDVACAHGATVSEIDDALKFYLMSRGIPAAETEKLLIRAFLGEVTDAIPLEAVRTAIEAEVDDWIDGRVK